MDEPLFRTNEHGDIWQEPTLFDQGGPVPPPPAHFIADMDPDDLAALRADQAAADAAALEHSSPKTLFDLESPADALEPAPRRRAGGHDVSTRSGRAAARDYIRNGPARP